MGSFLKLFADFRKLDCLGASTLGCISLVALLMQLSSSILSRICAVRSSYPSSSVEQDDKK